MWHKVLFNFYQVNHYIWKADQRLYMYLVTLPSAIINWWKVGKF